MNLNQITKQEFEIDKAIEKTVKNISCSQLKNGGFPRQHVGDDSAGVWSTCSVLFLHRKYPFLKDHEVKKIFNYIIGNYCYIKSKDHPYCGWGSFSSEIINKKPIPIVTAYSLMSLYGLHYCNKRLFKLYNLAMSWLISEQNNRGFWEDENDYCTNMFIVSCVCETLSSYNHHRVFQNSMKHALTIAKNHYSEVDSSSIDSTSKPFYYIISRYLDIEINEYELPIDFVFSLDCMSRNRVYGGNENFSYEKSSLLYFLLLAVIDDHFFSNHQKDVEKICSKIIDEIKDNGFFTKKEEGSEKDCIWLTCDIFNIIISLCRKRYWRSCSYYSDICNYSFKWPWFVKVFHMAKMYLRLRRPVGTILRTHRNWLDE